MKFIKDILLFELNTTGPDSDKDSILQLSAILLDKHNLLEKDFFNTYIRVSYLDTVMSQHSKLLNVPFETIKKSPKIYEAIKNFQKFSPASALLSTHTVGNWLFLKSAYKKAAIVFPFEQHTLDLWTLGYIYTLNYGLKKMPNFSTFLDYFKLKQTNPYDSLEKARLEAEVFRKIIKEV